MAMTLLMQSNYRLWCGRSIEIQRMTYESSCDVIYAASIPTGTHAASIDEGNVSCVPYCFVGSTAIDPTSRSRASVHLIERR